ncbi:MAG: hypothetical protein IH914_09470, partial [candidate division Zixibacteria bacterium]|nr:hypothetical protein [candidate division Zixibacteria bacterium]
MQAKNLSLLSALTSGVCCVPPLILLGLTLIGFFGQVGLELPLGRAMAYFMPFDDRIFMR